MQLLTTAWNWRPEIVSEDIFADKPEPWTQERYEALRKSLSAAIPERYLRYSALRKVERLQCPRGVCDTPTDSEAAPEWLEKAGVDEASYQKALAGSLQELLSNGSENAINILRGVAGNGRLAATGPNALTLLDFIVSDKCFVSAALTEYDKFGLRAGRREAEKEYPPPAQKPK